MTAYDWSGERARRLSGTFEAHLDKPFKPDQLLSAVASTLDHRVAPE
jgi:CheY-like chemotaxis protein